MTRPKRPAFVIADYVDGILVDMPLACPYRSIEAPCDVVRHGLRSRRTGPAHSLVVCRCHAHGQLFSVYPPGFVPYARRPVEVCFTCEVEVATRSRLHEPANGLGLALAAHDGERLRETAAVTAGVPLGLMAAIAEPADARRRTRALAAALGPIEERRRLVVGVLAGRWGIPFRWHSSPPRLECLVPAYLIAFVKPSTRSGTPGWPPITARPAQARHRFSHDVRAEPAAPSPPAGASAAPRAASRGGPVTEAPRRQARL